MLIQLPNGNWIDPKEMVGVRYMEREYSMNLLPRVAIDLQNSGIEVINFDTEEEAVDFRDRMARRHNRECEEEVE